MNGFYRENCHLKEPLTVSISPRFCNQEGQPWEWTIRPLTQMDHEKILKRCQKKQEDMDQTEYEMLILTECVQFPDLKNKALQDSYGVMGEASLLTAMLTPGEYAYLKKTAETLCLK